MERRHRTWLVLAGRGRFRILQASGRPTMIEEIVHRDAAFDGRDGAGLPRGLIGVPAGPVAAGSLLAAPFDLPAGWAEGCAARILNRAAALGLFETLVLAGPQPNLLRLEGGLDAPALARLAATVPEDLLPLGEAELLRRLGPLLAPPP
ncbi:baeRF12 domain-containing protein [Azospirillum sp. ST 5-10]|uniref:baeRF12 domain-containing protein n=1 Tax=unclassified Azospirillum TaxID=2630922 RepID=UPI003F4A503C